jgi:hypothetical protein
MAAHILLGTYIETLLWGFLSAGTRTAARGLQKNPKHIGPTRMHFPQATQAESVSNRTCANRDWDLKAQFIIESPRDSEDPASR